jgi:hydrogenase maturation factor
MCREWIGRVVSTGDGTAIVDVDGALHRVSLVVLETENVPVHTGDWLAVHTGLAIELLTPDAATSRAPRTPGEPDEHGPDEHR